MKALFIIAQRGFRDEELLDTKKLLEDAGVECKIASVTSSAATGMFGAMVSPDFAVKEIIDTLFDVVIVVGGSGAPTLSNFQEVRSLIKMNAEKNKILAGICLGPMVLAKSGVLWKKQATVYETSESVSALESAGAIYRPADVVVDGKVITANGPKAISRFATEILRKL